MMKYNKKPELLEQRDEMINEVFNMFDKDNSGKIQAKDLKSLLYSIGRKEDDKRVKEFLQKFNKNEDSIISRDEFHQMLEEFYSVPEDEVQKVKEAFKIFDIKGNNKITLKQLRVILTKYCHDFTDEQCDELFNMIDLLKGEILIYPSFP